MKSLIAMVGLSVLLVSFQARSADKISVYKINWAKDGAVIGLTTAGSLWAYADSDHLIHPRCPCSPSDVNSFDRSDIGNENPTLEHLSDLSVAGAVAFPVLLDYRDVGWSKEFAEDMAVLAETLSVNGAAVTLAKYTVQRPLPRTYAGDTNLINKPGGYRSFYSGHTSVTVSAMTAAAMTYNYRHPGSVWPWVAAALVGSSVAYERVAAGRHFKSDVLIGGLAGALVGYAIPKLHHRLETSDNSVAVAMVEDGGVLLWRRHF